MKTAMYLISEIYKTTVNRDEGKGKNTPPPHDHGDYRERPSGPESSGFTRPRVPDSWTVLGRYNKGRIKTHAPGLTAVYSIIELDSKVGARQMYFSKMPLFFLPNTLVFGMSRLPGRFEVRSSMNTFIVGFMAGTSPPELRTSPDYQMTPKPVTNLSEYQQIPTQ
ncbi:hypothetical protein HYFRA_00013669 [Hymenoscyphus fraxineus]|uniref:Uncharacterized protein n=1 Tax=Hymenoscyphus fraxineus TaxID=746836 RepID=A0A9N9LA39_9HELO|nr:hypothetical protein HYFRA_00013669 [Hymenoscyphus fraxineus]